MINTIKIVEYLSNRYDLVAAYNGNNEQQSKPTKKDDLDLADVLMIFSARIAVLERIVLRDIDAEVINEMLKEELVKLGGPIPTE